MYPLTKLITLLFLVIIIHPWSANGQNKEVIDTSKEKLMFAAREIMAAAGHCTLITLDENSIPMVRLMDPFPPENDFTVWLGTNSKSRKVNQIKNNPTFTLYYQDSENTSYVKIHGKAQIINDRKEKQKRWKAEWEAFYPNDKEGFLLIKVTPEWMEILSESRNIIGDPETWRTPFVRFD